MGLKPEPMAESTVKPDEARPDFFFFCYHALGVS